ncbi:MAG: type II toxin-antitoxin system RelE/ParE family toxin [Sedimentisphaerales bacterium]|nr:type II toxin-antitoxin system RelE/ParE family toxin [Sedimentisphaerales bacterium]
MAKYRLEITPSAAKELSRIPRKDLRRIVARIQTLADDPRPSGSKKLCAQEKYRIRQGDYRVLYQIEDDAPVVCVVKIAHRRDVYR